MGCLEEKGICSSLYAFIQTNVQPPKPVSGKGCSQVLRKRQVLPSPALASALSDRRQLWEGGTLSPPVLTNPTGQRKHRGLLRMPRDHSTGPRFIYKIINQLANDPFAFIFYLRGRRPTSPNPMADHWDSSFALQTHWSYLSERSRCFTVLAVVTGLFAMRTRVRFKRSGRT